MKMKKYEDLLSIFKSLFVNDNVDANLYPLVKTTWRLNKINAKAKILRV